MFPAPPNHSIEILANRGIRYMSLLLQLPPWCLYVVNLCYADTEWSNKGKEHEVGAKLTYGIVQLTAEVVCGNDTGHFTTRMRSKLALAALEGQPTMVTLFQAGIEPAPPKWDETTLEWTILILGASPGRTVQSAPTFSRSPWHGRPIIFHWRLVSIK